MGSVTDTQSGGVRHGATGRLFAADGFSVPVAITYKRDTIMVELLERSSDFLEGSLAGLVLESVGGRGVVRTPGRAEQLESNLLRFVIDTTPDLVQRREFVRVIAARRVVLEDREGDVIADALTADLSGGGMLVQMPRSYELPADGEVHFTIYLGFGDDDDQVRGTASAIGKRPENQIAFGFTDISRQDRERLIRFVFDRQRVALAMTRADGI
jgi:hypothetical protein